MPFGWPHRLETGGGRLNNNFPHKLAIAQNILGGEILAVMGESRNDLKKVPIGEQVHAALLEVSDEARHRLIDLGAQPAVPGFEPAVRIPG